MSGNATWSFRLRAPGIGLAVTAAALLFASGCARKVKPCPVSGTVLVNGQPGNGVYVVFNLIDNEAKKQTPNATKTREDGSFSMAVREPGEYAVTVFWPSITIDEGEVIEGQDRFEKKHQDVQNPVLKVTIQPGENVLAPIRLTLP